MTQPHDDLQRRLARWKLLRLPSAPAALPPRKLKMVEALVEASRRIEDLYWLQSDPEALSLLRTEADPALRQLVIINGGRYDLLDGGRVFAGPASRSPGRMLYPEGITRDRIEQYVTRHPEDRALVYDPHTVLRWQGERLRGVPYHVEYLAHLKPVAQRMREAAGWSDDEAFAHFLRGRAEALLSGDYYDSNVEWVGLQDLEFDIIIGPHEAYIDGVLGVKTAYESAVLRRDHSVDRYLSGFRECLAVLQDELPSGPRQAEWRRGHAAPTAIMDVLYRSGDLRHSYQSVAVNLPNEPAIHRAVGSKKVIFKNLVEARLEHIVLPLAREIMLEEQLAVTSPSGYLLAMLLHETGHGLGPTHAGAGGQAGTIQEALGPLFMAVEEAKADMVGMFAADWLAERGILDAAIAAEQPALLVASMFRTFRYGVLEPHACAHAIEFNYLTERGAIRRLDGRYAIDFPRMRVAVRSLTEELLEIEAAGDISRAERLINRYQAIPADVQDALGRVSEHPFDIYPIFPFD